MALWQKYGNIPMLCHQTKMILSVYRMIITENKNEEKSGHCISFFNPIHKGHIEYFNNVKVLADELFVIVNNDHQRALKGSKEFQKEEERMIIVSNIKAVDNTILLIYKDRMVCASLEMIAEKSGREYTLAFANGGDQNNDTIPEREICNEKWIDLFDGLGSKIQPSS